MLDLLVYTRISVTRVVHNYSGVISFVHMH